MWLDRRIIISIISNKHLKESLVFVLISAFKRTSAHTYSSVHLKVQRKTTLDLYDGGPPSAYINSFEKMTQGSSFYFPTPRQEKEN